MNKIKKMLLALPLVVLLFGCTRLNSDVSRGGQSATTTTKDNTTTTNDNNGNDNNAGNDNNTGNTYSITYELNGGTNNSSNPTSFVEGSEITLLPATKEGYDFIGWSTDQDGTYLVDTIDLDMDWNLYAIFNLHTYNIKYHNVDKYYNPNPTTYTILNSNLTLTNITNMYIDFDGWYTTSTFDDDSLITIINTSSLKDYDLYAKYDVIKENANYEILANDLTYNGVEQELISSTISGGTLSYSLDGENYRDEIPTGINAGNYVVYYKVTGDETHFDAEGSINVTINQATYELDGITFNNASKVYNGQKQSLVINDETLLPDGVTVAYEGDGTNVGEYDVIANFTIDDSNYIIEPMKAKLTITKATYSGIVFNDGSKVYNGTAQQLEVTDLPEGLSVEYSGFGINVGDYEITATFTNSNSNYYDIEPITRKLTITKAKYNHSVTFTSQIGRAHV